MSVDYTNVINPMTAKMKRQWLKALRSGKYRKGRGQLHRPGGGYCCLGVANEEFGFGINDEHGFIRRFDYRDHKALTYLIPADIQHKLAKTNDRSAGFDKVIKIIESIEPYEGDQS